jgi:hypothetical protein
VSYLPEPLKPCCGPSVSMLIGTLWTGLVQDGDELVGLHCFRRLSDQVASAIDSINR